MTAEERRLLSTDAAHMVPRSGEPVEPPCGAWWQRYGLRAMFWLFGLADGRFFGRGHGELRTMTYVQKLFWIYKRHHTALGRRIADARFIGPDGWRRAGDHDVVGSLVVAGELCAFSRPGESASLMVSNGVRAALTGSVALANLEGVIGVLDKGTGEAPMLATSERDFVSLSELLEADDRVLTLANNHLLDSSDESIDDTIDRLSAAGIEAVGLVGQGVTTDRTIVEVGDVQLGVLASSFASNCNPEQRSIQPRIDPLHSDPSTAVASLADGIGQLRRAGAELICLSLHWGHEFEWSPRPDQVRVARELAECGADLIHGHHPHVIQPMELHHCRDGRTVPILYSLGNLVTTVLWPHLRLGLACSVEVSRDDTGLPIVTAVDPTPTVLSRLAGDPKRLILETLSESVSAPHADELERERIQRYAELVLNGGET